jgi:type I restriction enzyme, S subunit
MSDMIFKKKSLGKIIQVQRRKVSVEPNEEYSEIGVYSFGKGIFHKSPRTGIEIGDKKIYYVREGDFILQNVFAWEGAIAIASSIDDGFCGSHRFLTCKIIDDNCLPEYLLHYLLSKKGLEQIKKISPGSAGRNRTLNIRRIPEVDVPLPSVPEQQSIIDYLTKMKSSIHTIKSELMDFPSLLDDTRLGVIEAGCSGSLTAEWRSLNPDVISSVKMLENIQKNRKEKYDEQVVKNKKLNKKSKIPKTYILEFKEHPKIKTWAIVKLANLIYLSGRIGWKGLSADEYVDEGPLFLSTDSLSTWEYVKFEHSNHITEDRYIESPEIQLQNDDVLLAKDGSIGKLGIVKDLKTKATVNSSLLVIRGQEAFLPKFLFYLLSGPLLQNLAKSRIRKGSTPHLFERDIKNFHVSIPPLEEQQIIINELESILTKVYFSSDEYRSISPLLSELSDSMMSGIFSK